MCRFLLYQGAPITIASIVTEPANSIIHQSFKSSETEEPLNGDGFGVAWYARSISPRPGVFRSVSPAWSNQNLLELSRITQSDCVLAHVRAATPGLPVTELNCHPFTSGPFTFMHNGDVARFRFVRRRLLASLSDSSFQAVRGSTDSEHVFALFLDAISELPNLDTSPDPASVLADALTLAIRRAVGFSLDAALPTPAPATDDDGESDLNIAVSDGRRSVACRFTTARERDPMSLYLNTGRRYICEGGVCRMVEPELGKGAVIVSSEPLSDDPGWHRVPKNHLVIIREDLSTQLRPIDL